MNPYIDVKRMKEFLMEPTKNDKKTDNHLTATGNTSSELDTHLNSLRKTGITATLSMNKKAQMTLLNWAYDLVNQYNAVLKNNPMKLKDINTLPCSKIDAKLAIKLLIIASAKKASEDDTAVDLKNKFVSSGSFQLVGQENLQKIFDVSSFPEPNKYINLIISEQKALLHEINGFIEDIRKIRKGA
jgi:hypothetical protein